MSPSQVICSVCSRKFSSKAAFVDHAKFSSGHFYCDGCGKVYDSDLGLIGHHRACQNEGSAVCSICDEKFVCHGLWLKHGRQRRKHPWCEDCLLPLSDERALGRHRRHNTIHQQQGRANRIQEGPPLLLSESVSDPMDSDGEEHPTDGANPVDAFRAPRRQENDVCFKCTRCPMAFDEMWERDQHNIEVSFMCIMHRTYSASKEDLVRHIELHHTPQQMICPSCSREFPDISAFIEHFETFACARFDFKGKPTFAKALEGVTGPWKNPSSDRDGKLYQCSACKTPFAKAYKMAAHALKACQPGNGGGLYSGVQGIFVLVEDLRARWP